MANDIYKILSTLDSVFPKLDSVKQEPFIQEDGLDSGPGPEFPGYWKGTDKAGPGQTLVGSRDNKPKDKKLRSPFAKTMQDKNSSGASGSHSDKTKTLPRKAKHKTLDEYTQDIEKKESHKMESMERALEEMYKEFKDTLDKRPAREGSRHPRGHEPKEQYTMIKDSSGGNKLYTTNGWSYEQEMDHYDDVSKIFHYAVKDGKKVDADWTPYHDMPEEDFKLWVALGMPDRKAVNGIAPLDHDDLVTIAKSKKGTENLLKISEDTVDVGQTLEQLDSALDQVEKLVRSIPMDPKHQKRVVSMLYNIYATAEAGAEQSAAMKESGNRGSARIKLAKHMKDKDTKDRFNKGDIRIPHHSERKKTGPVDLSKPIKVKEYATQGTQGTIGTTGTQPNDMAPDEVQMSDNARQQQASATNTLKTATAAPAQVPDIAQALDDASKGKATNQADMRAIEPMMDVLKTASEHPQLANQMKPVISRAKQIQKVNNTQTSTY